MIDWQDKVDRPKLACMATGRAIEPGEVYFSGLRYLQERFERVDYCQDAWAGVQAAEDVASLVSWWRSQRPDPQAADLGPQLLSPDVLLTIFRDLLETTDRNQQCFAYLIGLLLMRKKKLRYLDLVKEDDEVFMLLEDKAHKEVLKLRDPKMNPAEERQVQSNLEDIFSGPVGPEVKEGNKK